MHSLFYFNSTLADNEISVFALVPPLVHTQPSCRCPPSHPVTRETTCEDASGTSQLPRVNMDTHHASLINDGNHATWWQSETGVAPVNITISLAGLRAALTLAVQFRSLQPQSMAIFYSSDGGTSFSPRQYYSSDCPSRFGRPNNGLLRTASDINCITSESSPLPNQVVNFRVLDIGNRPEATDYTDSPELQDFARATHVRLELLNWNTDVAEEQYFAVDEVLVFGQECLCNGHADACSGSTCLCQHDTAGTNCERCLPLFNNEPWAAATASSANQCEACECNNHAEDCIYNATLGAGVCENCDENTQGTQCQECRPFFYTPPGVLISAPSPCQSCDCASSGIRDDGICTNQGSNAGQCNCKSFVTGRRCDECLDGYYNLTSSNPDGCAVCECDMRGTTGGSVSCDLSSGQCACKPNVIGRDCSSCAPDHYGIDSEGGCSPCDVQCNECTGPGPANCQVSVG